jgi:putative ABC transport system permease protein
MMLFRLLTLRSVSTRPTRLLLILFGIILGVATILAIGITNRTALESVTRLFEDTSGKANLVVVSAESDGGGFSESILRRVAESPGVLAAVPSMHVQTLLASDADSAEIGLNFFGASTGGLLLYGIDPQKDLLVREYKLVEGQFLSGSGDEVVLVRSYAEENDVQVGQSIEVLTGKSIERLSVVGLIEKEGPGKLNNGAFGVMHLDTAQKYFYRQGKLDQIDVLASPELATGSGLEQLKENLQSQLGSDYSVIFPAAQGQRMTQMLSSYQIGLNFLSGMALFVGAFLIFNAFSMSVVERKREYGMLRTIGLTRSQVISLVLVEAAALGLIGSLLGLGLGIWMARGLTQVMQVLLNQDLAQAGVPEDVAVAGFLIGVLVAVVAAVVPAFQAGKISPLEALRVRASSREGWVIRRGWIPGLILLVVSTVILLLNPFPYDVQFRMGSLVVFSLFVGGVLMIPVSVIAWERSLRPVVTGLYGSSGRLASSNLQRSKLRTTLTVGALMIGVAMMVIVWIMTDSFKGDLDVWLEGYIGGDLYVASSLPMGKDVWRRLEAVPGVAAATPVRYFDVEWFRPTGGQEKITFMAVDPASYNQVTSFVYVQAYPSEQEALVALSKGDTVFISSVMSEKYGLQPGDELTLLTRTGRRQFRIAAVVMDYYNQGLVIDGSWLDMERYFRQQGANAFMVKVERPFEIEQVKESIEATARKRDQLIVASNESLLESVNSLMRQAFSMFDVLALIAMLVGFFGIMNTLTMNVLERTRELGMLRGVGMTRPQLVAMILAEAALMGIIGGILGILFGVILSRVFMLSMTAMSGYKLAYVLTVRRVILGLLISVVVSQFGALFPSIRAARYRILEAIQYE